MSFGENLSRLRKARGMNQEDLASRVQVSRQAISKWENDDAMPDLPKLLAVADALEISLDELCGRDAYATAPAAAAAPPADAPPAAPPQQRHALRLVLRFVLALALGFVLAMVLGMGGPPKGEGVEPPLLGASDPLSISGLGFSCDDKGYLSYHFTPSISGAGLEYRIIFTDSQGISSGYDAPCADGVCYGTVGGLLGYNGYTVSIRVSDGQMSRNIAVATNLNFGNYHVSWTPLD